MKEGKRELYYSSIMILTRKLLVSVVKLVNSKICSVSTEQKMAEFCSEN